MKNERGSEGMAAAVKRVFNLALLVGIVAGIVGMLLIGGCLSRGGEVPPGPQMVTSPGWTNFTNLGVEQNATVGSNLVVVGTTTLAGPLVSQAASTFGTWLGLGAPATITVTQGLEITPGGSYQRLTAAGAVSTGSIVVASAGRWLALTNIGTDAITISDTGTLKLGGNRALGQYDTLLLLSDGTNWLEVSYVDN